MSMTAAKQTPAPLPALDAQNLRKNFPALAQNSHGHPLAYLDTGASAQKPRAVIDAMTQFMEHNYANIHRGVYDLSQRATDRYEMCAALCSASSTPLTQAKSSSPMARLTPLILSRKHGGRTFLKAGDEILITALEHHANIVPWQMLRSQIGIVLRIVPVTPSGEVRMEDFIAALSPKTKLVAFAHVSNVLGTILPAKEIIARAHAVGAVTLIDGCQAIAHMAVDVRDLDADFYVFSGHKLYGPTGIGVLYGKQALLAQMPPYQGGGDMIASVSFAETIYKDPPHRFEAGTPPITEVIGLGAAIDYVSAIGMNNIARHEEELLIYATEKLSHIQGLHIIGTAAAKSGIISFTMDQAHPHDIGTILDRCGVAIRAGHHCAQPLMDHLGLVATARASFGLYTTHADIDALASALHKVQEIFG